MYRYTCFKILVILLGVHREYLKEGRGTLSPANAQIIPVSGGISCIQLFKTNDSAAVGNGNFQYYHVLLL